MERLIKIAIISIASFSLVALSFITKSTFIDEILFSNAFIIAIAIFTIHSSSSAILISQLNILNKQLKINFTSTLLSIKHSLIEDALIIFCILCISIVHNSTLLQDSFKENISLLKGTSSFLLLALLTSQLWIIYDILIAILNAFKFDNSSQE